jgi:hypothetical protein
MAIVAAAEIREKTLPPPSRVTSQPPPAPMKSCGASTLRTTSAFRAFNWSFR